MDSLVRRPLGWASGADLAGLRCWQGFAGAQRAGILGAQLLAGIRWCADGRDSLG